MFSSQKGFGWFFLFCNQLGTAVWEFCRDIPAYSYVVPTLLSYGATAWTPPHMGLWSPPGAGVLSHLKNLARGSQGQEIFLLGMKIRKDRLRELSLVRKAIILCPKNCPGSSYKQILKKINETQVFLETFPYFKVSTSVLQMNAPKQSPWVVNSV